MSYIKILVVLCFIVYPTLSQAYTDRDIPDHSGDTADMDDTASLVIGVQADAADIDGLFTSRDSVTKIFYSQYDDSGTAWGTTTTAITMTNATVTLGSHIYASTAPYYNPGDNTYYEWLMYFLSRPNTCDGIIEGGFVYASYSSNFTTWTTPVLVGGDEGSGARAWDCAAGNTGIAAAGIGAFFKNGSIYVVKSDGDLSKQGNYFGSNTNLTLLEATPRTSTHLVMARPTGRETAPTTPGNTARISGLFNPSFPGIVQPSTFGRIGIAYDGTTGELWIARTYAWPSGLNETVPCGQVGCTNGVQLEGSRVQLYTMNLGSPVDPGLFYNGTVQLKADWGAGTAYDIERGGACESPALLPGMTNLNSAGDDFAFGTFLRTAVGNTSSGRMVWLATLPSADRTADDCADTAGETDFFDHAFPQ